MTLRNSFYRSSILWLAAAVLLLSPVRARAARLFASNLAAATFSQEQQDAQEKEQERRDREQEARDREQEKRDREQETRDREQEKLDRMEELYDDGRDDLDEDRYERAIEKFKQLADMNGSHTEAAFYWKAYAENRLGRRDSALTTLAELKRRFPQGHWQKDASALELEVKQSSGLPVKPGDQGDEELKMLAIQGLMNSDPERAMPLLEKVISGSATPKEKSRALFVLAQGGSAQGREIIGRIARGQSNPELQRDAIKYLGIFGGVSGGVEGGVEGGVSGGVGGPKRGGSSSKQVLAEVYASSTDISVKRAVLRSYMLAGDKDGLFAAAKNEKEESVRREAIRQLGLVHGVNELQQLYQSEASTDLRREILQAFFLAGESGRLVQAAQSEKDPELRRAAIRNLGLIHSDESSKALQTIYARETDRGLKEEVLNAYFLQGNATALVAIAKSEKDSELKKTAVQKLSLMHSKEAMDYLMELLQK